MNKAVLLHLKKRQARREERSLLIANERRATQSGIFSGATQRAESVFSSSGVIPRGHVVAHLCSTTTLRSLCLAGRKNRLGSMALFIENAPKSQRLRNTYVCYDTT